MRRVIIRWMSCILGLLVLSLPAAEAVDFNPLTSGIPADFPVRVASRHSGQCWDVPNGTFAPGQGLQQYFCHTGSNQTWNIVPERDGTGRDFVLIRNVANPSYCVGARGGQLILDKCDAPEGTMLQWRMDRRQGFFVIQITALRQPGCIDDWAGSLSEGAPLQLYQNCHGGLNQAWILLPSR